IFRPMTDKNRGNWQDRTESCTSASPDFDRMRVSPLRRKSPETLRTGLGRLV
ncbi:hypothetical protein PoB_005492900, partial [Plakobranchus ocellatus]